MATQEELLQALINSNKYADGNIMPTPNPDRVSIVDYLQEDASGLANAVTQAGSQYFDSKPFFTQYDKPDVNNNLQYADGNYVTQGGDQPSIQKDIGNMLYAGGKKVVTDPIGVAKEIYEDFKRPVVGAYEGLATAVPQYLQGNINEGNRGTADFLKGFGETGLNIVDAIPLIPPVFGATKKIVGKASSELVDAVSNPKVYHSTNANFTEFDPDTSIGGLHWFSNSLDDVKGGNVGAEGGKIIKEAELNLKNPAGWDEYDRLGIGQLIDEGYDGLKLPDADGKITYAAFNPEQIKVTNQNILEDAIVRQNKRDALRAEGNATRFHDDALDYKMQHQAPDSDYGFNLAGDNIDDFMPDVLGPNGSKYYATGHRGDAEAFEVLRGMRENPDRMITVYRAVPPNVDKINANDWITTVRSYADDHAEDGWKVLTKEVPANEVWGNGDSVLEYGWQPKNKKK